MPERLNRLPVANALVGALEHDQRLIAMSHALDTDFQVSTPSGMQLYPEQRAGVEYALAQGGEALIADEPGVGKTAQALGVANERDAKRILVVAPANTLYNWKREAAQWLLSHDDGDIHVVDANNPWEVPEQGEAVAIMPYSQLGKNRRNLRESDWDLIIADESHYLKDPDTARTQEIIGCLADACGSSEREGGKQPQYPVSEGQGIPALEAEDKIFLTGTPVVRSPMDLWATVSYLNPEYWGRPDDQEAELRFRLRYTDREDERFARNPAELGARLRESVMVRRRMEDVNTDMPPKVRQVVMLDALARDGDEVKSINQSLIDAHRQSEMQGRSVHISKISRALNDYAAVKAPLIADYVRNAVQQDGSDVLFFSEHRNVIPVVEAELKDAGVRVVSVTADMNPEERQRTVDDYQNGEYDVMLASIGVLKEGQNVTRANRVIFGELNWAATNLQQAENRAWRRGQTRPVLVEQIVLADSLDGMLAEVVSTKQDTIDVVLGGSAANNVVQAQDTEEQRALTLDASEAIKRFAEGGRYRAPAPQTTRAPRERGPVDTDAAVDQVTPGFEALLAPQEEAPPAPDVVVEPPATIPADTPPAAFTETPTGEPTPSSPEPPMVSVETPVSEPTPPVTPAPTPEPPMAAEDPLDPPEPTPEPPAPAPGDRTARRPNPVSHRVPRPSGHRDAPRPVPGPGDHQRAGLRRGGGQGHRR